MAISKSRLHKNKIIEADMDLDEDNSSPELEVDDEDVGFYDEDTLPEDVDADQEAIEEEMRNPGSSSKIGKNKVTKPGSKEKALTWEPSSTLKAPRRRPGMVQRWIRYSLHNEDDPKNWTRAFRDGWTPRDVSTLPEGHNVPTIQHSKLGNIISVGDLILCEMREELFRARKRYFQQKYERQIAAIEKRPLADAEALGGPPIQRAVKRSVTYGRRKARNTSEE